MMQRAGWRARRFWSDKSDESELSDRMLRKNCPATGVAAAVKIRPRHVLTQARPLASFQEFLSFKLPPFNPNNEIAIANKSLDKRE